VNSTRAIGTVHVERWRAWKMGVLWESNELMTGRCSQAMIWEAGIVHEKVLRQIHLCP
jgi:hypothetical protein